MAYYKKSTNTNGLIMNANDKESEKFMENSIMASHLIQLQVQNRNPEKVKSLSITKKVTLKHVGNLFHPYTNLVQLQLSGIQLETLEYFPKLPNLKHLNLLNNLLSAELEHLLGCPKLKEINLSRNQFKWLISLQPLSKLKKLRKLWLVKNPFTTLKDDYRRIVFRMLPYLKMLDGNARCKNRNENEVEIDEINVSDNDDNDNYAYATGLYESEEDDEVEC